MTDLAEEEQRFLPERSPDPLPLPIPGPSRLAFAWAFETIVYLLSLTDAAACIAVPWVLFQMGRVSLGICFVTVYICGSTLLVLRTTPDCAACGPALVHTLLYPVLQPFTPLLLWASEEPVVDPVVIAHPLPAVALASWGAQASQRHKGLLYRTSSLTLLLFPIELAAIATFPSDPADANFTAFYQFAILVAAGLTTALCVAIAGFGMCLPAAVPATFALRWGLLIADALSAVAFAVACAYADWDNAVLHWWGLVLFGLGVVAAMSAAVLPRSWPVDGGEGDWVGGAIRAFLAVATRFGGLLLATRMLDRSASYPLAAWLLKFLDHRGDGGAGLRQAKLRFANRFLADRFEAVSQDTANVLACRAVRRLVRSAGTAMVTPAALASAMTIASSQAESRPFSDPDVFAAAGGSRDHQAELVDNVDVFRCLSCGGAAVCVACARRCHWPHRLRYEGSGELLCQCQHCTVLARQPSTSSSKPPQSEHVNEVSASGSATAQSDSAASLWHKSKQGSYGPEGQEARRRRRAARNTAFLCAPLWVAQLIFPFSVIIVKGLQQPNVNGWLLLVGVVSLAWVPLLTAFGALLVARPFLRLRRECPLLLAPASSELALRCVPTDLGLELWRSFYHPAIDERLALCLANHKLVAFPDILCRVALFLPDSAVAIPWQWSVAWRKHQPLPPLSLLSNIPISGEVDGDYLR